ncbi:MAG: LysM peptidoglycan-binding domain-containing protein [Actinomycetota bacterium]
MSDPPPYEPPPPEEDFYEWENEEEGPRHSLLWTRIVALVAGLLLVFFLGRITAGGDEGGADDAELTALQQENSQLEGQVTDLQAELDAQAEPEPEPTETSSPDEDQGSNPFEGETYTVQAGQGFQQIAEDALGDIGLAECIAEFNGLTLDSTITPGEELDIPAPEDC